MDGTLNYSKYSHTQVTPQMIKEDESEYNTYKNKGIPDNPICAVEFEAIKAAIFPVKSDYLYFVKSGDGSKHLFSNTYKQHRSNIHKIKKEKIKSKIKPVVKTVQKPTTIERKVTNNTKTKPKEKTNKVNKDLKNLWN